MIHFNKFSKLSASHIVMNIKDGLLIMSSILIVQSIFLTLCQTNFGLKSNYAESTRFGQMLSSDELILSLDGWPLSNSRCVWLNKNWVNNKSIGKIVLLHNFICFLGSCKRVCSKLETYWHQLYLEKQTLFWLLLMTQAG